MPPSFSRSQLTEALNTFIAFWKGDSGNDALLAESVTRYSSHRGQANGIEAVTQHMHSDFAGLEVTHLNATNVAARCDAEHIMLSAYLFGHAHQKGVPANAVDFGAVLILEFEPKATQPQITEIRLQISWADGQTVLLNNWKLPVMNRLWQPGDAPAILTSELDAPWHRIPVSQLPLSDYEAIVEVYYHYAWALDLADTVLLNRSFTDDVEADLPPMGVISGRRTLVSTMKAFRATWSWLQHYGEPLNVDITADGTTASVLLGRITPGHTTTASGDPLYGAHYRITMVKQAEQGWLIKQISYLPGWVSYAQQTLTTLDT